MKTAKIAGLEEFRDVLADRRITSDFMWASRSWIPKSVYETVPLLNSGGIINMVLSSKRVYEIIKELVANEGTIAETLTNQAKDYLIEIHYKRVESVLRCLAFIISKCFKKLYCSLNVNETKFLEAYSQMGNNPVLLLPSHKSYLDFIITSYLCYHIGMDAPRVAAAIDFQSMSFVGRLLRDSCSFFIRRTFSSDKLYSAVFSQYVHTLITYGDAQIEFFIEGTRSRTQKSLVPKYGFLTMTIIPFLQGKIPDITLLPISISYDRVLEDVLLVYELLGVPKPKESTKGLYKAYRVLKSCYGSVFVHFGDTLSVKEFFGNNIDRSIHNSGPVDLQNPTPLESNEIKRLAHAIVRLQQNLTVLTCFNLIATVMNRHVTECRTALSLDDLVSEVGWLVDIFRRLGAKVAAESDVAKTVSSLLDIHKSLVDVTAEREVKVRRIHHVCGVIDRKKMKGHPLSDEAMNIAVPLVLLQYYSNPCAHFLVNVAFIVLIIKSLNVSLDTLSSHFKFLRKVYAYEFVLTEETENEDFSSAFEFCKTEKAIFEFESNIQLGENKRLQQLCIGFLRNYIPSYLTLIEVLLTLTEDVISIKSVQMAYQKAVESRILARTNIHPASLSLDLVSNALLSFTQFSALKKKITTDGFSYERDDKILEDLSIYLRKFSPLYGNIDVSEHFSNFLPGKL